jgi:gliding motility-associated-like protein
MKQFFRCFLYFLVFIPASFLKAQNLVPNPGFEDLKTTPSCWTSGSKADFEAVAQNWFLPNDGTTDILSTLVSPGCITYLPNSSYPPVDWYPKGNQLPRTGNNTAGIKPYFENRREYLEVKLLCDLIPGKDYYCEMYVSLAENTNYAQNSIGMYFSDDSIYVNSFAMLNYTPQIVENAIIEDTVNWVKISGTFTATGTMRYLLIGSFATAAQMQTKYLGHKGDIDFSYYYVDDVLVKPVDPPELQITGDTVVCLGESIHLSATGWNGLSWLDKAGTVLEYGNNFNYKPLKSMELDITGNTCNWPMKEKITITVLPLPKIKLGKDTLICSGTSLLLDAGPGYNSYLWQDGTTGQSINISLPGYYSVKVTDTNDCVAKEKIQIGYYKKPKVELGEDIKTCKPQGSLKVATGQKYDHYQWQNNSNLSSFDFSSEGIYWVKITNLCGEEDVDTISISRINMFVPNLITSNGDGKNDRFEILGTEDGVGKFLVYNRYGENVYNNGKYNNDWSGENLSEDVYYFLFEYPTCEVMRGWVQILK